MLKRIICDLAVTVLLLLAATVLSFCFFYFGNKNLANITVIYILALILIALNTSGYLYGIGASVFCVAAVNYFFFYPYNMIDFSIAGYPVTFIGMLAISIITSTTTTSLKQQRQATGVSGILIVNTVCPRELSAAMVPPCASTISFAIARPSPAPPVWLDRA